MYRAFAMFTLVALSASWAAADDVVPAPWRGLGLYTFQEWEFHDPGQLSPDGDLPTVNPGNPIVLPGTGAAWTQGFETTGLDGYIGTGGSDSNLVFQVPNFIDFEPIKYLRVQINGVWDATPAPFVLGISAIDNEVGPGVEVGFMGSDETFPGFHRWEDWFIIPNPDFEQIIIAIPEGSFVNQVVIETTSIPEPAAVGIMSMTGLFLTLRRRNR